MGSRSNPFGFNCFVICIVILETHRCCSLDSEVLALLEFRAGVDFDPYGTYSNWSPNDSSPCLWSGVHCVGNRVQILDLNGRSLSGVLAPELGKLVHLRSIILHKNNFYGSIAEEIVQLSMLELLDLRNNDLNGTIPPDLGMMQSLKCLLLCNNKFEFNTLNSLSQIQCEENLTSIEIGIDCVNRKPVYYMLEKSLKQIGKVKGKLEYNLEALPMSSLMVHEDESYSNIAISSHSHTVIRRRLLEHSSCNLKALSASTENITSVPTSRSSGSFPAIPNSKNKTLPDILKIPNGKTNERESDSGGIYWIYIFVGVGLVLSVCVILALFCVFRSPGVTPMGPWKTGLSGQLQKAFVTGVPKLNCMELKTACEDFSNIIDTLHDCTVYKGTLSSGVEIAVACISVVSFKDWSKQSEVSYRKKIDMLSRVNHKNFVNLIGFCEEDEPFNRMMVFEYAPNGTLFEHLHVSESEHLNWDSRIRIIMGIAYCLQYMHHDLNPPVSHPYLSSIDVYLTDDYAAKIGEISFSAESSSKFKISSEDGSDRLELPPYSDPETNVYNFGILLLEIISGKLMYSEEQGFLVSWAVEYLNDKRSISYMIDPSLKSFKNSELNIICVVIQDCIQQDSRKRPTMKEVINKLREVISMTPEAASPRLSPLWWAELEIATII